MDANINHRLAVVQDFSGQLPANASVLDFGCGAGEQVTEMRRMGFDAWGCDVVRYSEGDACRSMYEQGTLRLISLEPYRIPFDDNQFDVLISNQVFEHVQDYRVAVAETHRVLKPGGVALHMFPPRWKPIEAHVFVPLAGAWRSSWWLSLWAHLGVRNEFQGEMTARQVAEDNRAYLMKYTNYLTADEIQARFAETFRTFRFGEDIFMKHSQSSKAQSLYRLNQRLPVIRAAYSALRQRVVIAIK